MTTLTAPRTWPKQRVRLLYQQRWDAELNLRHIKATLGMGILRCKTPVMAEKELWVHLLAYNLIRWLMAESARHADVLPRQLSFKHALQLWHHWRCQSPPTVTDAQRAMLFELMAQPRVANRPGRIEPRAVKRRPKPYEWLSIPRPNARARLQQHGHPNRAAGETLKALCSAS